MLGMRYEEVFAVVVIKKGEEKGKIKEESV